MRARHHQLVIAPAPMLLTTAARWATGRDWILEPKWDGYRFVARVGDGRARCWTLHGTDLTSRVRALADESSSCYPTAASSTANSWFAPGPTGEAGQNFNRLGGTVFGQADDRLSLVLFDAPVLAGEQLAARQRMSVATRSRPPSRLPPARSA